MRLFARVSGRKPTWPLPITISGGFVVRVSLQEAAPSPFSFYFSGLFCGRPPVEVRPPQSEMSVISCSTRDVKGTITLDASTRVPSSICHVLWACPKPVTSVSQSCSGRVEWAFLRCTEPFTLTAAWDPLRVHFWVLVCSTASSRTDELHHLFGPKTKSGPHLKT